MTDRKIVSHSLRREFSKKKKNMDTLTDGCKAGQILLAVSVGVPRKSVNWLH